MTVIVGGDATAQGGFLRRQPVLAKANVVERRPPRPVLEASGRVAESVRGAVALPAIESFASTRRGCTWS